MGPPITRPAGKKMEESTSTQVFVTPASSQDTTENDVLPLDEGLMGDDINLEPQNATPRRNQRANQQQQPARCQVERPNLKDVLTQLTQEILTTRGGIANQPNQAPAVDVPEDPNFNWTLQKLPAETKFPAPCTGVVQRIAAVLLARLPTMAARDQHDARFVLGVVSDWPDLDDEIQNITFQRLNLYTIVAAKGIPSSFAVQAFPANYLLPPGVQPVQ